MIKNKNFTPLKYQPALDGIRALAITLVMFAHANFQLFKNGGIGVSVFFALSGFLITTLLLEEFNTNNNISLKGFYVRRTMRLFPALYVMLIFVFIYAAFFRIPSDQKMINHEILSSALYVLNISWTWGWGTPGIILYHTWSLGVEEQFYLFWPILLFLFLRIKITNPLIYLLAILISIIWGLNYFEAFPIILGSILKVSIFIGCLAALLRFYGFFTMKIPLFPALLSLIIIFLIGIYPKEINHYNDIFNISSVLSVIIIFHIIGNSESIISKFFSNKIMVFIGKISYSLYLWHLPIFKIFSTSLTFLPPHIAFIGKFIVSFLFAIASWYLVEKKATALGRKWSAKIAEKQLSQSSL